MSTQDVTEPKQFLGAYVKRMSASFGINNNPTTLELDLVEGNPNISYDVLYNATGFQYNKATPGKQHRFTWGAFDFVGIVQNWTENFGPQGKFFSVKLADPRFAFGNVPITINGFSPLPTGQFLWNYLNPFAYFGNPVNADSTIEGMSFVKIREYLETTGLVNLYNNIFTFSFSTGYASASGSNAIVTGVPTWYRIPGTQTSLDQIINQTSNDMGMDWYAYVEPSTYVEGGRNKVQIQHIPRVITSGIDIINVISGCQISGTLISYRRGQELRSDAIMSVLGGGEQTSWRGVNDSETAHYWGRSPEGTAMTTAYNESFGIVLLDHIRGTGIEVLAPFTISLPKTTFIKTSAANVYPPTVTKTTVTQSYTGYNPSYQTMRAALYSQKSWETIVYFEHNSLATAIGIVRPPFLQEADYLTSPEAFKRLSIIGSGVSTRTEVQNQLINAVYEATKTQADNYWGKSWLVNLPTSQWLNSNTFKQSEIYPRIEYEIADAAWSEDIAMPSGVTNHVILNATNNPNFKDNQGKLKAFCSLRNGFTYYDQSAAYPVGFPYFIDYNDVDSSILLREQGPKMVFPIQAEQYDLFPNKAIVTMPFPIKARMAQPGFENRAAFYDFLIYLGYTSNTVSTYDLMQTLGDNFEYGLAAPRLINLWTAPGNYGIHIPLKSTTNTFGPFVATGNVAGPLTVLSDTSLNPATFGNYANMFIAGSGYVGRSLSTSYIMDYGDLSIAGLPIYNIGSNIGVNATIGGISVQVGQDGLITNYSIKTFGLPLGKLSKNLTDKINQVILQNNANRRDIVWIRDMKDKEQVYNNNTIDKANALFTNAQKNGYLAGIYGRG